MIDVDCWSLKVVPIPLAKVFQDLNVCPLLANEFGVKAVA